MQEKGKGRKGREKKRSFILIWNRIFKKNNAKFWLLDTGMRENKKTAN